MTKLVLLLGLLAACDGVLEPTGSTTSYVFDKVVLPIGNADVKQIGWRPQSGNPINAGGLLLGNIPQSVVQRSLNYGLAHGLAPLIDVQEPDSLDAPSAGVTIAIATRMDNELQSTYFTGNGSSLVGSVRNGTLYADGDSMTFALTINGEDLVGLPMMAGQVRISHDATGIAGTIAGVIRTSDAAEVASRLGTETSLFISEGCDHNAGAMMCICFDQLASDWAEVMEASEFCGADYDTEHAVFDGFGTTDVSVNGITGVSFAVGFHAVPL